MEVMSRNQSCGTAVTALFSVLTSALESVALESVLDAGMSLLWILSLIGSTNSGPDLFGEGCGIIRSFPLPILGKIKAETILENKDNGESDDEEDEDEDEDDDEGGDQDDDGGEEDLSGDEGNEQDGEELEVNGGEESGDEDRDEDDDDDDEGDGDGDDEDDEEDEEEEEEEDEDQPPAKKRK